MLGDDQRAQLATMLRNQPQYHPMGAPPSAAEIGKNGEALAAGYDKLKAAGNGSAWQGLQNKFNGLFSSGGATPNA
jgi:hypothetical protein